MIMGETMPSQDETNRAEWRNDENWGGAGAFAKFASVYFSKKDNRTWVPKKWPAMGWTINLAHRSGVLWLFGTLIGIPLFMTVVFLLCWIFAGPSR